MKKLCVRQVLSFVLIICLVLPNVCPAFAETTAIVTKIEDVGSGKMFIQETDEKLSAIGADNTIHVITVSIKYKSDPDNIYQWVFTEYPLEEFALNDISFWEEVLDYAEGKLEEATVVSFLSEEIPENEPMIISSSTADLVEDLETLHGQEYTGQLTSTKVIDGHIFHMYENLTFSCYSSGIRHSWNTGITIATMVVGTLGLAATTVIMSQICGVLGLIFTVASMTLSAGALNQYTCNATFDRYVKKESGSSYYALSHKIVTYKGYEDVAYGSRGRACVIPETKSERYSHSQDHFINGIFDEAYNNYLLGA